MLHVNRATLLGRAGRNPDVRTLKGGGKVAAFSLATNEKWTDREGRPAEATEWHRAVVYGPAADAVQKMLRKGDAVLVEGRIATREYRDKDGTDRTITEIVVAGPQGTVSILPGRRAADPTQESDSPTPADAGPGSVPGQAPGSGEPVPAREPGKQAVAREAEAPDNRAVAGPDAGARG